MVVPSLHIMATKTIILLFLAHHGRAFFLESKHVCYKDIGCFENTSPFTNSLGSLPESPDKINVKFWLSTRNSGTSRHLLKYNDTQTITQSTFDGSKPIKIIIHGYMSDGNEPWVLNMAKSFLKKGDFNVIAVDWQTGAAKMYQKAVANTRVVGALTSLLLQTLRDKFGAKMEHTHLVGHSLGAQTSGYIGSRIPGLGRITGLDPAGPLFENYDPEVRLDPADATFVDVIHTDALPIEDAGFGTRKQTGHIDFFPNGGGRQPGCPEPYKSGLGEMLSLQFTEAFESVACSHERSYYYFTESILSNPCHFVAYPCKSYNAYTAGNCTSCGNEPCPIMGYDAINSQRQGSFYLQTNSRAPYCESK